MYSEVVDAITTHWAIASLGIEIHPSPFPLKEGNQVRLCRLLNTAHPPRIAPNAHNRNLGASGISSPNARFLMHILSRLWYTHI